MEYDQRPDVFRYVICLISEISENFQMLLLFLECTLTLADECSGRAGGLFVMLVSMLI